MSNLFSPNYIKTKFNFHFSKTASFGILVNKIPSIR